MAHTAGKGPSGSDMGVRMALACLLYSRKSCFPP